MKLIEQKHKQQVLRYRKTTLILTYLLKYTTLALKAESMAILMDQRSEAFDIDLAIVGIDNRCSACISHSIKDIIGLLRDTIRVVKGFGGSKFIYLKQSTIKWHIIDDNRQEHTHIISNSFYVPEENIRLVSSQYWARHVRSERVPHDTSSYTYYDKVMVR